MDKRLNFSGGEIGVTNTELDLMPNSNREGINGLASAPVDGANCILTGVNAVVTNGVNCVVSDGYVFLNNEVLKVDSQTVTNTEGNNLYEFQKQTTDGGAEYDREYRNGNTNNVAEINRAIVVSVAALSSLSVTGNTMLDQLKEDIRVQSDFNETDPASPAFIQNQPSFLSSVAYGTVDVGNIGPGEGGTKNISNRFNLPTTLTATVVTANVLKLRFVFSTAITGNYIPIISVKATRSGDAGKAEDTTILYSYADNISTRCDVFIRETANLVQDISVSVIFVSTP